MYELAEWMRTTPLMDLSNWLSATAFSQWIQMNFWVIPTIQTVHILAIAATFASAFMICLHILRRAGSGDLDATASRFLPWIWWGLVVLIVTGILMIIGEPHRELINPIFWMKMILVIAAAAITLWFQRAVRRDAPFLRASAGGRGLICAGALAVIALWCVIIVLGRWIAYAPI